MQTIIAKPDVAYGQDASRILEDIMGASSRPQAIKKKMAQVFTWLSSPRPEKEKAAQLIDELELEIGSDPELIKARAILHRMDIIGRRWTTEE